MKSLSASHISLAMLLLLAGCRDRARESLFTPQQLMDSKIDLAGEAALKQPEGPTYDFFDKLLPPLRYVDSDFRHYPINLSAPAAMVKGRLVSNGSAINARAR